MIVFVWDKEDSKDALQEGIAKGHETMLRDNGNVYYLNLLTVSDVHTLC